MLTQRIITERDTWNEALRPLPTAHILQSWEWGEFKQQTTGWQPLRLMFSHDQTLVALASVGLRRIGPLTVMYCSKGPCFAQTALDQPALQAEVLRGLVQLARQHHAIWLKIDPDIPAAAGVPGEADDQPNPTGQGLMSELKRGGWRFSDDQVQFRNTVIIDLRPSEDELLAAMSQNTRRKVRTAEKKEVTVRDATLDDLATLYRLYQITGSRDGFLIRPPEYYQSEWKLLMQAGLAHALIAEYAGQPIAHVILFHFGHTCWYFYGASSNDERERMPNYLLQWAAMRWAKAHGYARYDLWGAPDVFDESDRMWGVYEFKRGFRGQVTRYLGAWDYAPYPPLYAAYTRLWPRLLAWLRRRAKK